MKYSLLMTNVLSLSWTAMAALTLLPLHAVAGKDHSISTTNGKPADLTKPVQVFILLGQSNMVGLGKIKGGDGSLEFAVKEKQKYPYLADEAGTWIERKDVRFVRMMQGRGMLNNEWMTVKGGTIGPELGIGHVMGQTIEAPVMILKSCIGNRSLGWDLLPPGSERYEFEGKVYPAYKERPDSWPADPAQGKATVPPPWLDKNGKPIDWYAGKQYDDDTADAKKCSPIWPPLTPTPLTMKSPDSFSGRAKKTAATPHTPQNTRKTSSALSNSCATTSPPPKPGSSSPL